MRLITDLMLFAWLGLLVLALAGAFSPVRLVSRRGICRLVPRLAAEDGGGLTGGGVAVFDLAVGNDLSPSSVPHQPDHHQLELDVSVRGIHTTPRGPQRTAMAERTNALMANNPRLRVSNHFLLGHAQFMNQIQEALGMDVRKHWKPSAESLFEAHRSMIEVSGVTVIGVPRSIPYISTDTRSIFS